MENWGVGKRVNKIDMVEQNAITFMKTKVSHTM